MNHRFAVPTVARHAAAAPGWAALPALAWLLAVLLVLGFSDSDRYAEEAAAAVPPAAAVPATVFHGA